MRRAKRLFNRLTRRNRVQPQGETKNTYTPSGAIERQIELLEDLVKEGYLQEDEIRPVIDNLINNGREAELQFRQQAAALIGRGWDIRRETPMALEVQPEPQGETKTQSIYAIQQEDVPMAIEAQPVPREQIPTATRVVGLSVQDITRQQLGGSEM